MEITHAILYMVLWAFSQDFAIHFKSTTDIVVGRLRDVSPGHVALRVNKSADSCLLLRPTS